MKFGSSVTILSIEMSSLTSYFGDLDKEFVGIKEVTNFMHALFTVDTTYCFIH